MIITTEQAQFILLCVEMCIAHKLLPEQELAEALDFIQKQRTT